MATFMSEIEVQAIEGNNFDQEAERRRREGILQLIAGKTIDQSAIEPTPQQTNHTDIEFNPPYTTNPKNLRKVLATGGPVRQLLGSDFEIPQGVSGYEVAHHACARVLEIVETTPADEQSALHTTAEQRATMFLQSRADRTSKLPQC